MNRYPPPMLATADRQTQRERALGPCAPLILLMVLAFPAGNPAAEQRAASPNTLTELVDFLVVSDDGKPVIDLSAGEIAFKVDGRARPISSVQFVELDGRPAGRVSRPLPKVKA
jgi:hypothetical protein